MDVDNVLETLRLTEEDESAQSRQLRQSAHRVIEINKQRPQLPEALLELLKTIVKPLFTASKHPALTSTGRKTLVPPPPSAGRFNDNVLDDDSKPWKNGWTVDLLSYILTAYGDLPEESRKATLEAQFHLLIPPILNMIDDADTTYKAHGCQLLRLLCEALVQCQSDMLKRTGLSEVFVDALKPNFMLLPTLTPEDESLQVLTRLYPAFLALIAARFISLTPIAVTTTTATRAASAARAPVSESEIRQTNLILLLRHGILASLSHLSAGTSTTYLRLTTYLISQISPVVFEMGISAVTHLQNLLPMLRIILCDPFGAAAPDLLLESLGAMETLIQVCAPRIKAKWWAECLRGIVGCWCTVIDDESDVKNEKQSVKLQDVKNRCQRLAKLLGEVVGEDLADAKTRLLEEDTDLQHLFMAS